MGIEYHSTFQRVTFPRPYEFVGNATLSCRVYNQDVRLKVSNPYVSQDGNNVRESGVYFHLGYECIKRNLPREEKNTREWAVCWVFYVYSECPHQKKTPTDRLSNTEAPRTPRCCWLSSFLPAFLHNVQEPDQHLHHQALVCSKGCPPLQHILYSAP